MNISDFINEYYLDPIIEHEGYNLVNTLTYAIIALCSIYFIYRVFKKYKIIINKEFVINTLPFVLFGSTVRVITDSIDTGTIKPITVLHEFVINSHIYDYGVISASPGIYIVTALLFFLSLAIAQIMKNEKITGYIGLVLWIPHFFILVFMFKYLEFTVPILLLTAIPFFICLKYFKDVFSAGIVGAHALDGAATFFIIDFFGKITGRSYVEQHVIPAFIGDVFGTFLPFYILKIAIAFTAALVITNEKQVTNQEKYFITLLLIILGLAPGLRDMLRMAVGA